MLQTLGCNYFRRAFGWCVPIGALAGLIGLGGGEFRLPVLMHSVGFGAESAVPINLTVSLVTLTFALGTRSGVVSLADVVPHGAEIAGLAAGGMIAALYGNPLVQRLTSESLVRMIAILLAALGVLMCIEALLPFSSLEFVPADPTTRFAIGCILGSGIGFVSSLLGVAGGELLIPTLIFLFGADIVTAGSASILISLCLISVGLWRYWRIGALPPRQRCAAHSHGDEYRIDHRGWARRRGGGDRPRRVAQVATGLRARRGGGQNIVLPPLDDCRAASECARSISVPPPSLTRRDGGLVRT